MQRALACLVVADNDGQRPRKREGAFKALEAVDVKSLNPHAE